MNNLVDDCAIKYSTGVEYTSCPIFDVEGNRHVVDDIGGVFCRYLESQETLTNCYNLSPIHGRSCLFKSSHGYFHIKGVGWSFGPPFVFSTAKEPELIFGLLESKYASREVAVSARLSAKNITNAKSIAHAKLVSEWLPQYNLPHGFTPSLLYTQLPCPYRVADLAYIDSPARLKLLKRIHELEYRETPMDVENVVDLFLSKLTIAVSKLHLMGGVNDHLTYDNVTITGDIIDFEWVYVPGIPCPDGTTDISLDNRQEKSGLYILEIALQLSSLLGITYSLKYLAERALPYSSCKNLTKLFERVRKASN